MNSPNSFLILGINKFVFFFSLRFCYDYISRTDEKLSDGASQTHPNLPFFAQAEETVKMKRTVNGTRRKTAALLCGLMLLSAALGGCTKQEETAAEPQKAVYFTYFDTVSYVYSYAGDSADSFSHHAEEVSDVLETYHRLLDIYNAYDGLNNLYTVNENAGGEPVRVDEKLIDFLLYARTMYEKTDGAMNVMMGSVLRLWHDCREEAERDAGAARLPDAEALREASQHMAIGALEIDAVYMTVRIADEKARLDVGALGKGYAAERAAEKLESAGVSGYVINVGGNLRLVGAKEDGTGWFVGVRDPNGEGDSFAAKLVLKDTSCVTSGVYERYFTVDGQCYHHIIDPDTLYPADYCVSLTVVTKDSGYADALSTALFCMPCEEGEQLLKALSDAEALWIFADGTVRMTDGMAEYVRE